jgi:integrase
LSARQVATARKAGLISDGGGLYLRIGPSGTKAWVFRYGRSGRAHDMGLGAESVVRLAKARERAAECRRLLSEGLDPIQARRAQRRARQLEAAKLVTFRQAAETFIDLNKAGWRNAKHAAQWSATLETYAYTVLGDQLLQMVDTDLVTKVLEPIWTAKHETATRVRQRIEKVLDAATTRGQREGPNPARWRGHLENILPKLGRTRTVEHHAALPYSEIGAFLVELRQQKGVAAAALEFTIITAARTGEAIGARWREIDFEAATWTVPAVRMKAHREHVVPLASAAVDVLRRMEEARAPGASSADGFVFAGDQAERHLSNMAMAMLLRRMSRDDVTVHGFRSSFRDWAAERTSFPREVAEMALAHAIDDKTEAAYRRGDLFEKRRRLADAWAKFCNSPARGGDVVLLRAGNRPGGTGQ